MLLDITAPIPRRILRKTINYGSKEFRGEIFISIDILIGGGFREEIDEVLKIVRKDGVPCAG